eukprot:scaffold1664_cov351-Prasinococcus_capsulatus_cf.AAC.5
MLLTAQRQGRHSGRAAVRRRSSASILPASSCVRRPCPQGENAATPSKPLRSYEALRMAPGIRSSAGWSSSTGLASTTSPKRALDPRYGAAAAVETGTSFLWEEERRASVTQVRPLFVWGKAGAVSDDIFLGGDEHGRTQDGQPKRAASAGYAASEHHRASCGPPVTAFVNAYYPPLFTAGQLTSFQFILGSTPTVRFRRTGRGGITDGGAWTTPSQLYQRRAALLCPLTARPQGARSRRPAC